MAPQPKPVTIKADVFWAQTNVKNQYSDKYQVNLCNLSDAAVAALKELGLEPRNKGDEQGFFIVCKSLYPIKVYDSDGEEIPADIKIGNGSRAVAQVSAFTWKSGEGKSADLKRLNIIDLVEFEAPTPNVDEAL